MVASLTIWSVLTFQSLPGSRSVSVSNPIPVEITGVPSDLVLVPQPGQAALLQVRLRAVVPAELVDQVSVTWFQATVDVSSQTKPGTQLFPVQVRSLEPGVTIDSFVPSDVSVTLDQEASKQFPISPVYQGNLPTGYVSSPVLLDNTAATVRGPASVIQQVAAVIAVVRLDNHRATFSDSIQLIPQNAQGGDVTDTNIQVTPKTVGFTVPIQQTQTTRTAAVVAQVTGQPALGYVVAGVTVDPTQVSVVGNPSALENLTQLATDTVDVSGATSDVQKPVNIQAPSGTSVAGVQNATVTVLIRPIAASATLSAGPVLVGLPAADTANIAVSSVNVTVTGAAAALKNLQPSDLQVTLNVDKLAPGTHEVPVSVAAPSGITVSTITPATVRVTIIPPPTPTPTPTETASPTPTPTETPSPTSTPTVTGTPPTATPKPVPPTSTPSKG